ncbi:poly(3-hydroxyalkanoate) synthetase [Sphingobium boeckii]|uniref:Poly(3-hydroxyalkanoate) synthetase n=1 Tax=Sphingobium boeckii TaxID=1082345 RepID=A0A7W9AHV8_9SPHN|nr:poly(3-hydroxyalkanoate) synthetase [Sphingobium boeckii]
MIVAIGDCDGGTFAIAMKSVIESRQSKGEVFFVIAC